MGRGDVFIKISVCDAVMGNGKTQAAITMMNRETDRHFVFVTQFLDECTRIEQACPERKFRQPINKGQGKLGSFNDLFRGRHNIASNTTVAFASAETRVLPNTGESLAIIIGKIIKYLADLKTVAFTGNYADLINKPNPIKYYDLTVSGATATYTAESTVLNVSIMDATTHESVIADVTVSADNVVTVTCAEAPANALTARITYVGA